MMTAARRQIEPIRRHVVDGERRVGRRVGAVREVNVVVKLGALQVAEAGFRPDDELLGARGAINRRDLARRGA